MKRYVSLCIAGCAVLLLASCGNSGIDANAGADLKRAEMLENYGRNIIIPSYDSLKQAAGKLQDAADAFSSEPSESGLTALQQELKAVRTAWQDASLYQFGPAETIVLRPSLNTFPADTAQIESNIDSGDYTLGSLANRDASGLPALDYLLHGIGSSNQEILSMYTQDGQAPGRTAYLVDNVSLVSRLAASAADEWAPTGGNYIGNFLSKENAGTDMGSALGMAVNALVMHYERYLRDGKIGIPSGVRSAGVPRPTTTESYYAGYSLELAIANLEAVKNLYLGTRRDGTDGTGLKEYLEALNAGALAERIENETDEAIAALRKLSDPLAVQIETNNDPVLAAFTEMQDVVVLLKADMTSVLGVTITFQDNDGD